MPLPAGPIRTRHRRIRPVTYIGQKNVTEIRDTFIGLRGILRKFPPNDTGKLSKVMIEDARDGAA